MCGGIGGYTGIHFSLYLLCLARGGGLGRGGGRKG